MEVLGKQGEKRRTVAIIGGGLGGLFTGALLAKEGLRVTVLEKNATIGGGLQSFRRFGQVFDTGMHVIAGMAPGGNIRRICDYLGISSAIRLKDVDNDCASELHFLEDGATYRIACGHEGLVGPLARQFPAERDNLRRYADAISRIARGIDLLNLRPAKPYLTPLPDEALLPADAFIAQYIGDRRLRSVLAYMNPLYGGVGGKTPAYVHIIISHLYQQGAARFVDGSAHMADLLASVITSHGGEVRTHSEVSGVNVSDGLVSSVDTTAGDRLTADWYVSDIHPSVLLRLVRGHAFTKAYATRVDNIPDTFSAFSLYLRMKPQSFPYINHSVYLMSRYDDIWQFDAPDRPWPLGMLLMTPPVGNQGPWSDKVLLTVPMRYDKAAAWEHTVTGHRGPAYGQWKRDRANEVLAFIDKWWPGFSAKVDRMVTASPLTIRDYYGARGGCLAGYSRDCHNLAQASLPVATKVRNLLLTGQYIYLHGFSGVPLTAILTSEAIVGTNHIIQKINATCGRD